MAESMTWLQAQVKKEEWDKINERRLKLNLKWSALILPATEAYLDQLETNQTAETSTKPAPKTPKSKKGSKKTKSMVKAEGEGGGHGDEISAGQAE
jgi:hypothetical protein